MYSLPIFVLLTFSILATVVSNTAMGTYTKKFDMSGRTLWQFNLFSSITCGVVLALIFIFSKSDFTFSWFSVLIGICFAFAVLTQVYFNLRAMSVGPFAYTIVIVSLSCIIPTLQGVFFGETFTIPQYIGVALMIICIVLSPETSSGEQKKASLRWIAYCALTFVASGSLGVFQKIHQTSIHAAEMPCMLLTTFITMAILSHVMYFSLPNKKHMTLFKVEDKNQAILPVVFGAFLALPHSLNLFLSGKLPTIVFFPFVNLLPMILTMLYAFVVFREKFSVKRWIGLAVGVLSTVFVSGLIKF